MKKIFATLIVSCFLTNVLAQENIDDLLAAGINDAKRFSTDYLAPATDGIALGVNNGWFNHGKSLKKYGFEFSIIGNANFIKSDKKTFELNVNDYENIRFPDNSTKKMVATSLGHNDPDVTVIVTYDDPIFGNQEVELTLPTGIGAANINIIPTAFVQAGFSPFKGTVIKGRFFPKIDTEDAKIGLYGFGIQQEFTKWLPANKVIPVSISGLIAYTHLDGSYDFTDENIVEGSNQRIDKNINTMVYQLIVSTKLKILNFYAGLGYIDGKSKTDLLGRYRVSNGVLFSDEIVDPFSVNHKISMVKGTIGTNLKLGVFMLNLDYTLAEFNSLSFGTSLVF
ncbi:DUF6588 family protein [Pseudofulvibacter geojedonensis]|uniref:DUF6588 family protein n=1 Tax=Pseudofulvibacter geojedonensis TaxID=1123758 RepID=A0ABW3I3C2_9FLAO